eukprot:s1351_g7.t1
MSYPKWCAMLVPLVLKSRTPFAAFLSKTIQLTRSSNTETSTPTFFPVPVVCKDQFNRMPSHISAKARHALHLQKAVHTVCMALNFWHSGGVWPAERLLKRRPNAEHAALYRRVASLIKSDGLAESFSLTKSGRKHPELIARLSELSAILAADGGASASYERSYAGVSVPKDFSSIPELIPYADLDADRLKLYGSGHWDVTSLLPDELVMAYREPRSLLAGLNLGPHPICRDSAEQVAKLAHVWDKQGLLRLHDGDRPLGSLVKVFNCYKSLEHDRQIGDRRGQNSYECRVRGPSADLPSGSDIFSLKVDVDKEKVVLIITDRKDYYHQLWVSTARSTTNAVGPAVHRKMLEDTDAYSAFIVQSALKSKSKREQRGDDLHVFSRHSGEASEREILPDDCFWVSFGSVLQGDHAGVEIATAAHECWLQEFGLLHERSRLVASRSLRDRKLLQGLVIDDFFAASVENRATPNAQSKAMDCYNRSQEAYQQAGLLGSPQKDVVGCNEGKLVGAYVNSSEAALARKLCTVGAPAMKRVALSFITLALCSLAYTTDVLHLCLLGGWVSLLTYRRPMMAILAKSYHVVDQNKIDSNAPCLVRLSRSVANELLLLAVLMPLAVSDLGAAYYPKVFATDASMNKGAICWADASERVIETLWKSCRSKGSNTRILSPAEVILRNNGMMAEEKLMQPSKHGPERPFAYDFDFLEIFSGASLVTDAVAKLGLTCGPPLDIGISEEYNMSLQHVISWVTYLLAEKKLKAVMLSPPCTAFSIMRRPRLRSKESPFGFDPADHQTNVGNVLGQRGAQTMYVAAVNGAAGIMETTYSSYLKYLPGWKTVKSLEEAEEVRCDSCAFGSIHLKPFRFLGVNAELQRLSKRCECVEPHVRNEGGYTKASATYVPRLVDALAFCFADAIRRVQKAREEDLCVDVKGLENQLVNEVSLASHWEVHSSWTFKKQSHINILEEASILRLANFLSRERKPLRVVALVDSYVVRGATSKGRTSSRALSTILRRVSAMCVASALYMTLPFVPTRWNAADDPTRDVEVREACGNLGIEDWSDEDLFRLSELPKTRKWASLWVRFILRLLGPRVLQLSNRSVFRQSVLKRSQKLEFRGPIKDFDDTMGFPGEGPWSDNHRGACCQALWCFWIFPWTFAFGHWIFAGLLSVSVRSSTWIAAGWGRVLCCCLRAPYLWLWIFVYVACLGRGAEAMPIFPRTAGERTKAALRSMRPPIPSGRPVLPVTQARRESLLQEFFSWAIDEGVDVLTILEEHHQYIDDLNILLERYGRLLYQNGKSYAKYAETINGLTALKPAIRRMLSGAWDFGYAWNKFEPSVHHCAMPGPVCLALISTGILWGWTRFAGALALMWAGLLRPGELLGATRSDLLLPSDGDMTLPFGLLAIRSPKTRFSVARHQSVKLDMPDMLRVIELFLGSLKPHQKIWPLSGATLRTRFRQALHALQLPLENYNGARPLELASIRAGAATWIMQMLENGDVLQRRGRWANRKMMDIYVQEVTALIYLKRVPPATREVVTTVADSFLLVLNKAEVWERLELESNSLAKQTRRETCGGLRGAVLSLISLAQSLCGFRCGAVLIPAALQRCWQKDLSNSMEDPSLTILREKSSKRSLHEDLEADLYLKCLSESASGMLLWEAHIPDMVLFGPATMGLEAGGLCRAKERKLPAMALQHLCNLSPESGAI